MSPFNDLKIQKVYFSILEIPFMWFIYSVSLLIIFLLPFKSLRIFIIAVLKSFPDNFIITVISKSFFLLVDFSFGYIFLYLCNLKIFDGMLDIFNIALLSSIKCVLEGS